MTYFVKRGTSFIPTPEADLDISTSLPPGNYTISQDPRDGSLFFSQGEAFPPIGKTYGSVVKHTDRIFSTFLDRPAATGILLNGEKGSGKTLLAKSLSIKAAELGIPTIIINNDWTGDTFNKLIQDIQQPAVILFDEFEKVYDREKQECILTLLDGVFPSKKLFVLTCNDKYRIDSNMRNRPGRIFYMLDFAGLAVEFIREYCQDQLNNTQHIESVVRVASMFGQFNFDMLKALVEEMNRYNEDPFMALEMLNAKPQADNDARFDICITLANGMVIPTNQLDDETWGGSPVGRQEFTLSYYEDSGNESDADKEIHVQWRAADLCKIDPTAGVFTYQNRDKVTVTFTRIQYKQFNYSDYHSAF